MDAGHDERGRQVRARLLKPRLQVLAAAFPNDPALDVAVSRALLERVAAGELPPTLRLARPARMVAFGKQDAVSSGYAAATRAARLNGYEAVLRLAGGRPALFHDGTLVLAHAEPDARPRDGIHSRFTATAELLVRAFRGLGADARVGEVPGEYCPGAYSVNAGGRLKLAGLGQRLIAGGAHTGGVVVVAGAQRVRQALDPVYEALGLDWDPSTAGALADELPGLRLERVREAILAEYARGHELVEAQLDAATLARARRIAPEHAVAAT